MKRYIALLLTMVCILALAGCGLGSHTGKDYPAAIMVEGTIYLKSASAMPAEIDEGAIVGYTTSYTDTYPEKDGETNFNRELNMPYAKVEGGIAVLYENEWYLCTPKDAEASADHGPLITVESNGERVQPYPLFLWAETWTEGHGWLNADGANFLETHSEFSEEIPAITYGDDFEIHCRDGVSFLYLSIYNANLERIHHNVEQSVLSALKDGEYYIGFVVDEQGRYIESEKTHEMKGYECVLKLIKAPVQEISITPSDSNDPSAVLATMASVRAESFTNPDPNFLGRCVTTEQLAAALNAAVPNQISEEEFLFHGCDSTQIFPHWYIEYAFLEGDPNDFNSKDRHLSVRCGLPENIVEVSLVEDNHRDTAYFEDTALYWLIRSKDAFEDRMTSRDSVAYEQFKPLLIDQMERTLASVSDNPGNFNDYELKRFTIAWTYDNEQDGSHVKLYNFSFGLLTDTPETIGWAGGMTLDSHLRVVNVGEPKYFAVKYRNGQVASTAFLASDYELGRSAQDKERINNALSAAEQTGPGISVNILDASDAYRAVLHGQTEYYDPESNQFFNLSQVQAHGYNGNGPGVDLSNFTVVDLDRDGVAEVVVVANWGADMTSHSIILHYQNGTVYGYTRYIRQFNYLTLKADGTFSWAGSAFHHGYATLSFGPDELVANRFTYIDANVDSIMYVVDNALATEEDFNAAITKQETKPDATWYKLNEDDVGRFFE